MNNCPHCNEQIDDWYWIRFEGLGAWEGKDRQKLYACPKCKLRFDGSKLPVIKEIKGSKAPMVGTMEGGVMRYY